MIHDRHSDLCRDCLEGYQRLQHDHALAVERFNSSLMRKGDFPPRVWGRILARIEDASAAFTRRCAHY